VMEVQNLGRSQQPYQQHRAVLGARYGTADRKA
jgi:hypothetical protein